MSSKLEENTQKLLFFDGECNLCSGFVQFIIKRDPQKKFKFASLQSELGQNVLQKLGHSPSLESLILKEGDRYFERSTAALKIARHLKFPWPLAVVFFVVPRFLRNWIYNWVAKNRYRFFGKRDECWLPSPEFQDRFL